MWGVVQIQLSRENSKHYEDIAIQRDRVFVMTVKCIFKQPFACVHASFIDSLRFSLQ
jgi:hypothetical protein